MYFLFIISFHLNLLYYVYRILWFRYWQIRWREKTTKPQSITLLNYVDGHGGGRTRVFLFRFVLHNLGTPRRTTIAYVEIPPPWHVFTRCAYRYPLHYGIAHTGTCVKTLVGTRAWIKMFKRSKKCTAERSRFSFMQIGNCLGTFIIQLWI